MKGFLFPLFNYELNSGRVWQSSVGPISSNSAQRRWRKLRWPRRGTASLEPWSCPSGKFIFIYLFLVWKPWHVASHRISCNMDWFTFLTAFRVPKIITHWPFVVYYMITNYLHMQSDDLILQATMNHNRPFWKTYKRNIYIDDHRLIQPYHDTLLFKFSFGTYLLKNGDI